MSLEEQGVLVDLRTRARTVNGKVQRHAMRNCTGISRIHIDSTTLNVGLEHCVAPPANHPCRPAQLAADPTGRTDLLKTLFDWR